MHETVVKQLALCVMHPLGLLQGKKLHKEEKPKSLCSRTSKLLPYVGDISEISHTLLGVNHCMVNGRSFYVEFKALENWINYKHGIDLTGKCAKVW